MRWLLSAPPVALVSAYSSPVTGPLARISASASRTTTTSCDGITPDIPAHLLMVMPTAGRPRPGRAYSSAPDRVGTPILSPAPPGAGAAKASLTACLPHPELVDLREAVGVEGEVTSPAGEQFGKASVRQRHPGGLADGEAIGPGPDVLCGRRGGELERLGPPDEASEPCVAEPAAVGGAGRVAGVVVRARQEVVEELAGRGIVGDPLAVADIPPSVRVAQAPVELGVAADPPRAVADLAQGGDERAGRRGGDEVVAGADEVDGRPGGSRRADQRPGPCDVRPVPASVVRVAGPGAVGPVSGEVGWQHLASGDRPAGATEGARDGRPVGCPGPR